MTTPDIHTDLVAKMIALVPASFTVAATFALAELPPGGVVDEGSTWVKQTTEKADPYDANGAIRQLTFQVKRRFDKTVDATGAVALAAMVAFYDAIHGAGGLGAFTINAHDYLDLVAASFPRLREETYIIMDVVLWLDQVSV